MAPLIEAQLNPQVKLYWYVQGLLGHLGLVFAGIGLLTFPLWVVLGWWAVGRRYDAWSATLTDQAVNLRSGVWFRVEKTVPLDKIQDLSLRTGPLLNAFGLGSVQLETAGSSSPQGMADLQLVGLSNAQAFRDAVLAQRDRLAHGAAATQARVEDPTVALLTEIRDLLAQMAARR
jgi:membrane protein YdbS with pleckstrin-like domain